MDRSSDDLLVRLRAVRGAAPALDALAGEAGVHVVGGAVRDVLLGREPRELDLLVEGDAPAVARRVAERLGGTVVVHERFATATVETPGGAFDLASARRERYPIPGALPDVELGATVAEDLARRDFTVNAIAVRVADGATSAWPGAVDDLDARRLRVLHDDSFADDPTRLVRLARYAARLGFAPDPGTLRLAEAALAAGAPATVSGARLGGELRLALTEPLPAALVAVQALGLGRALVDARFAVDPELTGRALALCPPDADAGLVALAAASLDVPAAALAERLDVLAFPARERDTVTAATGSARALAAALEDLATPGPAPASRVWALLRRVPVESVALAGALAGPRGARTAGRWLRELRDVRLAIGGEDLLAAGKRGPAVGRGLDAAMAALLDGRARGRDEQLAVALSHGV